MILRLIPFLFAMLALDAAAQNDGHPVVQKKSAILSTDTLHPPDAGIKLPPKSEYSTHEKTNINSPTHSTNPKKSKQSAQ